jgi:hypothetical protein
VQSSTRAYQDETLPAGRSPAPGILPKSRQQRKAKARANARTPIGGRYEGAGDARMPANPLPVSRATDNKVDLTVAGVQDPIDLKTKLAVAVNRRIDLLEYEYSHRRISEAAYLTGRQVQAVLERAYSGRSSSNWSQGDRVDAFVSKELQIISGLEKAEAVQAMMGRIVVSIGQIGARFLKAILLDGQNYAQLAAMRGQSNEPGKAAAASRFRHLLEDLAEDWAATGARA